MDQQSLSDLLYVAAFFLGGLAFAVGPFVISHLLAPRTLQPRTRQVYECGMVPIGDAWVRFGIVYYLYALIFLAFDVDVLFLFPVALAYNKGFAARDFVEIVIFVGILSLAIIYAWKKGVFKWERKVYNPR
ncbi:MAG: NADH-quinone oxidoreductase subunit A [Desulfobulbaceae bacterium]|nr:NADH-quinone oxidoreductase subunit A [Desulfobulbaceae bacterium]